MEIKPTFNLNNFFYRIYFILCCVGRWYLSTTAANIIIVILSIRNIIKIQMITIKIQL